MPCQGPVYGDPDFFAWEDNPKNLVPMLCKAIKLLRTRGVTLEGDLARWAKLHDEEDAQREKMEAAYKSGRAIAKKARRKLTFEEYEALKDTIGYDPMDERD